MGRAQHTFSSLGAQRPLLTFHLQNCTVIYNVCPSSSTCTPCLSSQGGYFHLKGTNFLKSFLLFTGKVPSRNFYQSKVSVYRFVSVHFSMSYKFQLNNHNVQLYYAFCIRTNKVQKIEKLKIYLFSKFRNTFKNGRKEERKIPRLESTRSSCDFNLSIRVC